MIKIEIKKGDITVEQTDAIVNAANNSLLGGGGVDGAIHRAAGSELLEACRKLNGCQTGEAKLTAGFRLAAKYVIHTVGPVWKGGVEQESEKLKSAYKNSLKLADENGCKSIAFPNISTGVYGFPKEKAVLIVIETIDTLLPDLKNITQINFVCFDEENYQYYLKTFNHV
jgi:O-acetyl-ADP-ribose deacetylase (regulator of RNase III)